MLQETINICWECWFCNIYKELSENDITFWSGDSKFYHRKNSIPLFTSRGRDLFQDSWLIRLPDFAPRLPTQVSVKTTTEQEEHTTKHNAQTQTSKMHKCGRRRATRHCALPKHYIHFIQHTQYIPDNTHNGHGVRTMHRL